ncbi:MAG: WXG100 family type VII secretion target [Peptococcaceae bacterium]|nr:WXG100 family type VII secretion target [Peptococcaceae bacterium]
MSDEIKTSLEEIALAATTIKRLNQEIMDQFQRLERNSDVLYYVWQGDAAEAAESAFKVIAAFQRQHFKTLNEFTDLWLEQAKEREGDEPCQSKSKSNPIKFN